MKSTPPSAIEQTRVQALKEFRSLLHEALSAAVAGEGVPEAFRDAINWNKLIDQTEEHLVEGWSHRLDADGNVLTEQAAGTLSLLPDDEHEQQVLSEMFVNEVASKDRERLEQLEQLLSAIGGERWQGQRENPLGPSVWVQGVRGGMQQFRCTAEERAWLLQRLIPLLMAGMGNFYGALNTRISKFSGIPLNTPQIRRAAPTPVASEMLGHDLVENTSASRQATAAAMQEEPDDEDSDVLERIFSLMGAQRMGGQAAPAMMPPGAGWAMPSGYPGAGGAAMAAAAPVWSDADLRSVLAMLQNNYVAAPTAPSGAGAGGSTARLFEAVNQTAGQMGLAGGSQSMPGPAHDMMELVNMLFEALLDGRRLDERARSQLSRLVIPYVRVALLDRRMFMQSRHPARRVLNQLVESLETASADAPQFRDLREIAFAAIERILTEFQDDFSVFESLDKSLAEALNERRRGAEIAERRMADAERGRERRSIAMASVTTQLQQAIGSTALPESVRQFLTGPWQHHQTILILREGIEGDQAQSNRGLLESLARACQRGESIDLTPLRAAFEAVFASSGQPPEEVDALLAEMSSAISEQSSKREPASPARDEPVVVPETHNDADIEAKLLAEIANFVADDDSIPKSSIPFNNEETAEPVGEAADFAVEEAREPTLEVAESTPDSSPPLDDETSAHSIPIALVAASANIEVDLVGRYRALKVGDWLDLVNEDGRITAARISWTSPISGRHMLSNRRGQRLLVASIEELAAMELEGQVHIRSNDAAFDVALNALADRLTRTAWAAAPK